MNQQLAQEINRVLYSYSLTAPEYECTEWSHILAYGPLDVFARKLDHGSIEVEEKVKGIPVANYIRPLSMVEKPKLDFDNCSCNKVVYS